MFLPPQRSPFHGAGKKVEHRTDGAAMTVNVQFIPMAVCPLLLFGSRHANPQQVRISPVDGFDDCPVLFLREFRFVGWGVRFDPDVGVDRFRFLPNQIQHLFAASHEEAGTSLLVQPFHLHGKQVPSGNTFCRLAFCFQFPASHHDTCSVGNQCIPFHQRFGKERILQSRIIGVRIDGID